MSIPTRIDEEIIGIKLLLFFEYKLSTVRLEFESLILIDCVSSFSSSQLNFYGEIKLDQKTLLPPRGYRETILPKDDSRENLENSEKSGTILDNLEMENFSIMNVVKKYFERNCKYDSSITTITIQ